MKFYRHITPVWFRWLFPQVRISGYDGTALYLTFDDGPAPGITDDILQVLDRYRAKATFFCSGEQVQKHPGYPARYLDGGHKVGMHGYTHRDAWNTPQQEYLADIEKSRSLLQPYLHGEAPLFRPPYGRLTYSLYKRLREKYRIVLWKINSGDFDDGLDVERSIELLRNAPPGSIILFHDGAGSSVHTLRMLEDLLPYWKSLGYKFDVL